MLGAAIVFPWKNAACHSARVPKCQSSKVPEFQSATGDPPFYLLSKSSPRVKAFLLTVLIMADRINVSVVGLCGTSFGSRCPAVLNTLCAFWTLPTIPPTASGSTQPKTQTEHKQLALAPLEHNEISYKPLYECCLLVLVVTVARSRTRCY